jgi:hypothetical protein
VHYANIIFEEAKIEPKIELEVDNYDDPLMIEEERYIPRSQVNLTQGVRTEEIDFIVPERELAD